MIPLSCNLCGTVVEAGPDGLRAATDVCSGCKLRTRHRAYGAFLQAEGDPTTDGLTLVCHATPAEREYLFANTRRLVNFDVRPAAYLDFTMDIQDMSRFEAASVDTFVAFHVLNHVADDNRALREIARVLTPGGAFLCTVPFRRGEPTSSMEDVTIHYGAEALAQYGVGSYRRYGLEDFRDQLSTEFDVHEFEHKDPLIGDREIVFTARRRAG